MADNQNELPDNLNIVTNLLTYAFHRYIAKNKAQTSKKELELFSNVSINDLTSNN